MAVFSKLSQPSKKMIMFIGVVALVFIAGGAIFYRSLEALYFACGVILLSALNVLKVFLLERVAQKTLDMEDANNAKVYIRFQYILRYFLTAAFLLAAALIPFISVWGAIFGVFTLQISVMIVRSMKIEQ